MRFQLDSNTQKYFIQGYGAGWIKVSGKEIRRSVLVAPDQLIMDWFPQTFAELEAQHCAEILQLEPEIVLLGTGQRQQFPQPRLLQDLLRQGIGVEVMDTAAACRTYNVLMLEERRVVAALLMEGGN